MLTLYFENSTFDVIGHGGSGRVGSEFGWWFQVTENDLWTSLQSEGPPTGMMGFAQS